MRISEELSLCVSCGIESPSAYCDKCSKNMRVENILHRSGVDTELKLSGFDWSKINKGESLRNEFREYVKNYDRRGWFLYGKAGRGKTHLAHGLVQAIIRRYAINTRIYSFVEFINQLRLSFNNGDTDTLKYQITNVSFLLIDDIGAEKETEFVNETIYEIVDYRYRKKLPTIITTNLMPENINDERVVSRIIEMCRVREIVGKDFRLSRKAM